MTLLTGEALISSTANSLGKVKYSILRQVHLVVQRWTANGSS